MHAAEAAIDPARDEAGFALYVHWPFCLKKCPYCDFNSHVREGVDHARWEAALVRELEHAAEQFETAPLTSIFFGGGTPSLMAPDTVRAVIERAVDLFGAVPGMEVTLEANPTSVEGGKFRAFRQAGVDRVSVGVQALNDADLKFLGRQHSAVEARSAIDLALETFDRASFDLIYARPGQSLDQWRAELAEALSTGVRHLSLYQLTIEPETEFGKRAALGQLPLADPDRAADLFDWTLAHMEERGFGAYEISNHAQSEADRSRHNLVYWRMGAYLGIGPGAHGRVWQGQARLATEAERVPERWLSAVEAHGHGLKALEPVDVRAHAEEVLMMGLRLTEGVSLPRLETIAPDLLNTLALEDLQTDGFVARHGTRLFLTRAGQPVLNEILRRLLAG